MSDVLRSGTVADDSKSSADCSASHGVITDDKISNAVVVCKSQTMPLSPSLNLSGLPLVSINKCHFALKIILQCLVLNFCMKVCAYNTIVCLQIVNELYYSIVATYNVNGIIIV